MTEYTRLFIFPVIGRTAPLTEKKQERVAKLELVVRIEEFIYTSSGLPGRLSVRRDSDVILPGPRKGVEREAPSSNRGGRRKTKVVATICS